MIMMLLAATALTPPADFAGFKAQATEMVLSGETLPPDYLIWLNSLSDSDRLLAVAYLRRAGLLKGDGVPLERILTHAEPAK